MTKKPTRAEIEVAREYVDDVIKLRELQRRMQYWHGFDDEGEHKTRELQKLETIQNTLAWCAEQEQKGE